MESFEKAYASFSRGGGAETSSASEMQPLRPAPSRRSARDSCADCFQLSYMQRMAGFVMFFSFGILALFLSSMYIATIVLGGTSKFAMMYTLANILLISSTMFLVGPSRQLQNMFSRHRLTATVVFMFSMFGTIFLCVQMPSFFLILPMIIIQFLALLSYVLTYLPYGAQIISSISAFCSRRVLPTSLLPV